MIPTGPSTVKQNLKRLFAHKGFLAATIVVLVLMGVKFYVQYLM